MTAKDIDLGFKVDDRVIPKDRTALWAKTTCTLIVLKIYPCETPEFKGKLSIELEVRGAAKNDFTVRQFAEDYQKFVPNPPPPRFSPRGGAH